MSGRALPPPDDDRTSRGLPPAAPETVHDCEDGWVGRDAWGRSRPCSVCRPHLVWRLDPLTGRGGWTVDRSRLPERSREKNTRRTA